MIMDQSRLISLLSQMQLQNDATWCYANATIYGLFWMLSCQTSADPMMWGPHSEQLHQFLHDCKDKPVFLKDTAWFEQLLECWGMPQTQQDCGEFVSATLQWMSSTGIDMSWERRCELGEQVCCHDCSHVYMPLHLQFSSTLAARETCTFSELLHLWQQVDGMKAALLRAAPMICVQLDRLVHTSTDQIEKSSCAVNLDAETRFPVFSDGTLACAQIHYTLVAAAAHLGQDRSGHYQAVLKLQPTLLNSARPVQWLVTQDNQRPTACWRPSQLLCQNLTIAWFVRSDCLYLPKYHAEVCEADFAPAPSTVSDTLLALLSTATKDESQIFEAAPPDTAME